MFAERFFPAIKQANLRVLWVEFLPPGARRRNHLQGDSRNLGQDSRNKHPWQEYGLQKWGNAKLCAFKDEGQHTSHFCRECLVLNRYMKMWISYVQVGITVVVSLSSDVLLWLTDISKKWYIWLTWHLLWRGSIPRNYDHNFVLQLCASTKSWNLPLAILSCWSHPPEEFCKKWRRWSAKLAGQNKWGWRDDRGGVDFSGGTF